MPHEAAAAAGAENDQPGIGGQPEQLLGGMAFNVDEFGVLSACAAVDVGVQFLTGDPVLLGLHGLGGDDPQAQLVPPREVRAEVEGERGGRRAVVPDDDVIAFGGSEVGPDHHDRAVRVGGQVQAGRTDQGAESDPEASAADDHQVSVPGGAQQNREGKPSMRTPSISIPGSSFLASSTDSRTILSAPARSPGASSVAPSGTGNSGQMKACTNRSPVLRDAASAAAHLIAVSAAGEPSIPATTRALIICVPPRTHFHPAPTDLGGTGAKVLVSAHDRDRARRVVHQRPAG